MNLSYIDLIDTSDKDSEYPRASALRVRSDDLEVTGNLLRLIGWLAALEYS